MKTVVSLQELLDLEIRPEGLFGQYYDLLVRDLGERWAGGLHEVPCPGCGSRQAASVFRRGVAQYCECGTCGSLFVSPRAGEAATIDFYRHARSARFWREEVLLATAAVRREKIAQPRAEWVMDRLAQYAPRAGTGLDLSPYGGPLVEELCRDNQRRITAGFWLADLDVPDPGARVRVRPLSLDTMESAGPVDFVTAFDMIDRAPDLPGLVERLALIVRPGGLLFLTASNADGFDLQVLWDRAPTLTPPDKLNILSIDGLRRRISESTWELLELSTPGMFDVEQVRRVVEAEPSVEWPRFVLKQIQAGPPAQRDFQEYLQRNRLASFARVVARRR
jgi:ribosomal protein S27E